MTTRRVVNYEVSLKDLITTWIVSEVMCGRQKGSPESFNAVPQIREEGGFFNTTIYVDGFDVTLRYED